MLRTNFKNLVTKIFLLMKYGVLGYESVSGNICRISGFGRIV